MGLSVTYSPIFRNKRRVRDLCLWLCGGASIKIPEWTGILKWWLIQRERGTSQSLPLHFVLCPTSIWLFTCRLYSERITVRRLFFLNSLSHFREQPNSGKRRGGELIFQVYNGCSDNLEAWLWGWGLKWEGPARMMIFPNGKNGLGWYTCVDLSGGWLEGPERLSHDHKSGFSMCEKFLSILNFVE